MPIEFDIDHVRRFVTAKARGVVVLQDMLDYFDALAAAGAMPYSKLFDARELEARFDEDDLKRLAARIESNRAFDPRGAIAAVATRPETIAAVQRFKDLGGARRPIEIFATVEGARAWLALR